MTRSRHIKTTRSSIIELKLRSSILGFVIGDALGVPVEFISRDELKQNPVKDMIGYGTHNQPEGTWSDDSSMTFCTIKALTEYAKYLSLVSIPNDKFLIMLSENFLKWFDHNYWTPYEEVFDFGNATGLAMHKLRNGVHPFDSGEDYEYANGNGSLMRILPLIFYMHPYLDIKGRFESVRKISSITHAHILSIMACFYYLEYGILLLDGKNKFDAYNLLKTNLKDFFIKQDIDENEIKKFSRLLDDDIYNLSEDSILSSGYVLHSLEASIWCLLTTNSFKEAILKAVNLGIDTDTIGALTGGLAGMLYKMDDIPKSWIEKLAKKNEIENLIIKFENSVPVLRYKKLFSTY